MVMCLSDIIRLVHQVLAASKVKSVTSTILMNRDLHNANLAAILSVSVRLIENRLTDFSVNRLTGNIPVRPVTKVSVS